jgi:hypothetical protein
MELSNGVARHAVLPNTANPIPTFGRKIAEFLMKASLDDTEPGEGALSLPAHHANA